MDAKDLLNNSSIHHGRNLVRLMNRKGLKVEDLEKALQLSQTQIQELMEMKKIDDEMLDKLAKALDVSVETIKEMREDEASVNIENNTFNIENENNTNSPVYNNIVGNQEQTNNHKYDNVSFTQIIEAYRLMLKQEREEVSKLQKRVDELEKQKNRKPENE
ncbi:helix-turn-helix transcriptional regulator [uncultured Parabacteroides sp.]|uniref:helix-turn-helix domain-containing protein n=1 Tax=uncultured Parabacteroides sp. TaxID=512312 RepID=UPI0025EBD529|nr:helix-turn-helix transcriptional regulator [uncultured Parabacteroides sp.]